LIGGAAPTALQGRGALQDIDQGPLVAPHVKRFYKLRRVARVGQRGARGLGPGARGRAGAGVPRMPGGPAVRRGLDPRLVPEAAGKGTALADRALRWYLNRHAARMFAGSAAVQIAAPPAAGGASGRRGRAAGRPLPRWRAPNARCW
jgi:hypothetical protein